ncbi:unnamed protein product [Sympodiomycopsis kandeliae]
MPKANTALHRYFHTNGATEANRNKAPFALVTGSTGGMGEEWAKQLAAEGFNVIIQGRNAQKLETVKSAIMVAHPETDVRLLVTEATIWPNEPLAKGLADLLSQPDVRIHIVINNLGTVGVGFPRLEDESAESVSSVIISNSIFPAEITRMTLPHLKAHQPTLLANVTSLGAWSCTPYVSPYIGTKGFDVAFSRALYNEMAVEGQQVDVCCIAPGQVQSGMHEGPTGLMVPSSEDWTIAAIEGLRTTWWTPRPPPVLVPWRWHRWALNVVLSLPMWVRDTISRRVGPQLRQDYLTSKAKTD